MLDIYLYTALLIFFVSLPTSPSHICNLNCCFREKFRMRWYPLDPLSFGKLNFHTLAVVVNIKLGAFCRYSKKPRVGDEVSVCIINLFNEQEKSRVD